MPKPLLIVIGGPTASGKTALGIALARHFDTEILSADSRQCYKELNIGVAKPSTAELAAVKHHFISSHSIFDEVNAGVYERFALDTLRGIFARREVAILVGGTGLYIDALLNGIDAMPQVPDQVRQNIVIAYEQHGLAWLQQQLKEKDITTFKAIDQQNPQRMMRALEVVEATGKSISEYQKSKKASRPFETIKIALDWDRDALYSRINSRVDHMMQQGLMEETRQLLPHTQLNALQTVGYRELFSFFHNEISLETAVAEIKKNTRRYAKRQITWFKKDIDYHWLAADEALIIAHVSAFYKRLSE